MKQLNLRPFLNGSVGDDLKITHPDEYDFNLIMTLPPDVQVRLHNSNKPGYVNTQLTNLLPKCEYGRINNVYK